MFYSGSAQAKPGHGAKECLAPGDSSKNYPDLRKRPNWRKSLSAMHHEPGQPALRVTWPKDLDPLGRERQYATKEHAYHAAKFLGRDEKVARQFEADSGSVIAVDPFRAKSYGGKKGTVKDKETKLVLLQRPKHVTMNPKFVTEKDQWLVTVDMAKFTQWPEARAVLLGTGNAELTHWTRGKPQVVETGLMQVRDALRVSQPDG